MTEPTQAERQKLAALVAATNAHMSPKFRHKAVGPAGSGAPRLELYHSAPSLCSHKVRTTLAEKSLRYMSHDMKIMPAGNVIPQNYRPEYVRLRMLGAPKAKLVDSYSGESSVTVQGFDPCVVPTLIDHDKARVIVDSRVICEYIDAETEGDVALIPDGLAAQVDRHVALVDQAPHVAALYGAHPDGDDRPEGLRKNIAGVHAKKIRVLKALRDHVAGEPDLVAAYDAKIRKEDSAGEFVLDAEDMRDAHTKMAAHVSVLNTELEHHNGPWACGTAFTLADITWTCSLWRMAWLGMAHIWEEDAGQARVSEYVRRAFARPAFRASVIDWPGAHSPSPHVKEFSGPGAVGSFLWLMARSTDWREAIFGDPKIKLPAA